ncbi:MAG: IS200/IS605 family transposase [Leptolyngbya foveolarum]|uniref:IS200/IS605 family transposase n=1 Tax=Leptolyngbya foveolarum TaxID=47253 RepID=A0A2W4WVC2_9CYAN|nr:MAG: IS200/IS605 family transposase [Leptolyngbya foveolarum]
MRKKSEGFRHDAHSVGLATVHLVFVPKRRKPVLKGPVRTRLNEIFQSVAIDKKWIVRSVKIAPDHVHLLIEYDSKTSVAEVARAFKGRSSRYLRKEFPHLLKLPSLWPRSYFYETTGKVSTAKIEAYINDPHHW